MSFALGVAAALAAPFLMVVGFIVWDNHWSGSAFSLNMFKCLVASVGFLVFSICTRPSGNAFSSDVFTQETIGFLMLSSTIGLIIGDWTWLEGMRVLGARKVIVMDSLKPFFAALVGRMFLGEKLKSGAFVGLVCTVLGVLLVGLERANNDDNSSSLPPSSNDDDDDSRSNSRHDHIGNEEPLVVANETDALLAEKAESPLPTEEKSEEPSRHYSSSSYAAERRQRSSQLEDETLYGLCMGVSNVLLHTFGALITKLYGGNMNTWEINLVRFGFAGVVMLVISLFMHLRQHVWIKPDDVVGVHKEVTTPWYGLPAMPTSWWIRICLGVALVSFLHPALTNYAMFQVALALLLTLESVGPIYSLPLVFVLESEKPSFRASLGALLAVGGIAILAALGEEATE